MNGTNYKVPHCGALSIPHLHLSWAQIFASINIYICERERESICIWFQFYTLELQLIISEYLLKNCLLFQVGIPRLKKMSICGYYVFSCQLTRSSHSIHRLECVSVYCDCIVLYYIVFYCIVLYCRGEHCCPMYCDLLKIYCAPPNLGISRTWICRLNFAQRPISSGSRYFNEPEFSDSGPQLKIPPGGLVFRIFTSWKNPSTSAVFEPANLGSRAITLPRDQQRDYQDYDFFHIQFHNISNKLRI